MNDPSPSAHPHETWISGAAYEFYVGRWSRLVARAFLEWLAVLLGSRWLDVGCGTGALSQTILEVSAPTHVTGIDRSDEHVRYAQADVLDRRASFAVGDAQALPDQTVPYDAAVSGLVLNFLPQPEHTAREMARVVRSGGSVAAYI
jgi:ubiquinone/menaquinone biosynthesis C-methylase UbiE